jgi:hypothetical protein
MGRVGYGTDRDRWEALLRWRRSSAFRRGRQGRGMRRQPAGLHNAACQVQSVQSFEALSRRGSCARGQIAGRAGAAGRHACCLEGKQRCTRGARLGGAQVAKELVALHNELLRGDTARLERLRRTAPAAPSASRREQVGGP